MCVCVRACVRVCVCVCMYVSVCVCVCVSGEGGGDIGFNDSTDFALAMLYAVRQRYMSLFLRD